jgi:ribosomal protein L29
LAKESADLRHDVWKLALQRATGQTADASKLTLKKRELARALTILGERRRAANR